MHQAGTYVLQLDKRYKKERVGRILRMHANHRKEVDVKLTRAISAASSA
jgi:translation elongation factor EF-G